MNRNKLIIILSLIGIVLGTLSCFKPNNCVTVTVDRISTEEPEVASYIVTVWYNVRIHNHCIDTVRHYYRNNKQITVQMIPERRTTVFVSSDIYLVYKNDTIYSGNWDTKPSTRDKEFIIAPNQNRLIHFSPCSWIVRELYETKYLNNFNTRKDFWLDIVKHGVLHIVVDGKTHKVENRELSLEYASEGG